MQETMKITKQIEIAKNIFELTLQGELVKTISKTGQFINIKVPDESKILRRPISISNVNHATNELTVIYRTEGAGTVNLSKLKEQDTLDVLGPLGNGFEIEFLQSQDTAYLIAGGIGIPPMYELAKQLKNQNIKVKFFLGFANEQAIFYKEKFEELGEVFITTDDGSFGIEGNVSIPIKEQLQNETPQAIYSCGPTPLLKYVQQEFKEHKHAYISTESRMACGVGACFACVLHTPDGIDKYKKVCDDGPIFKVSEVLL